ncbi:MAG TPA: thymidine phosphorylase, partial [Chloroflexota bacterium]|nr:thymidine phosphorylase [Chloroflexota bacterium]
LTAPRDGLVATIDTEALGRAAVALGAGRAHKREPIDPAVGFVLRTKVGDGVKAGEPLIEVHANDERKLEQALATLPGAFGFSDQPVNAPKQVLDIISPS